MTQRDKTFALAKFHGGTPSNITDNAYLISIYSNLNTLMQMVIDINANPAFRTIVVDMILFKVAVIYNITAARQTFKFTNKETLVTALQNAIYEAIQDEAQPAF